MELGIESSENWQPHKYKLMSEKESITVGYYGTKG
jgi:hypothetical protein